MEFAQAEDTIFTESAQVLGGMRDILIAVEGTPGAIRYVNWPTAVAPGTNVRPITVNGLGPTDISYPATLEFGIGYLPEYEATVASLLIGFYLT